MKLNSLTDDCLLHLLDRLPQVATQAQLRSVCTRWKLLIEGAWRKVKKIEVTIGEARKCIHFDNKQILPFKSDGSNVTRFVTRDHFPCVTSFGFIYHHFSGSNTVDHHLTHYMDQWTENLLHLNLYIYKYSLETLNPSLMTQIDSMKSLKSLSLHLSKDVIIHKLFLLTNLKQLKLYSSVENTRMLPKSIEQSQLRELDIEIAQSSEPYLFEILTSLSRATQLDKLTLRSIDWDQFIALSTPPSLYPQLTSIKHLSMYIDYPYGPYWRTSLVHVQAKYRLNLNAFDEAFFVSVPIMFPKLETIRLELSNQPFKSKEFVDNVNDKLKKKFVHLSSCVFYY